MVQHLKALAAVRQLRALLPDDDADQELSLRGAKCRPESKRGSGRSSQEPGLAQAWDLPYRNCLKLLKGPLCPSQTA